MANDHFDRDELKAWLQTQPREVSIGIAARAAMRVLPLVGNWVLRDLSTRQRTIVLPLFRAMAAPRAAAEYPARGAEVRSAAARAFVAADAAAFVAARAAARAAAAAAAADDDAAAFADAAAATAAAFAAIAATAAFAAIAATAATAAALKEDRDLITDGMNAAGLTRSPLWHGKKLPKIIDIEWQELSGALLDLDPDWSVWTDWYEDRLRGTPEIEDLEIARLALPEELWEQGPAAVNPAIRKLIEGYPRTNPLVWGETSWGEGTWGGELDSTSGLLEIDPPIIPD